MLKIVTRATIACCAALLLSSGNLYADCTITPSGPTLLDGTVPPQEGVELYIYATAGTDVTYTAECDATENPASVVVLPATVTSVDYNSTTKKVTIVFVNKNYIEGSNVPAPPGTTTFSIALVSAVADGQDGPPAAMAGSWMATNIPPVGVDPSGAGGWELIPPSEDDPFFGYTLNGPDGSTGFFKMFIPDSMLQYVEDLINQESPTPVDLTWDDMAVFNDNQQASLEFTEVAGGVLVDIFLLFEQGANTFPDSDTEEAVVAAAQSGGGVNKSVTVGEAADVSLAADDSKPSKRQTVKLFGWVVDCITGEKIKITSKLAARKAKKRGANALKRYKRKGWKKVALDSECYYEKSFKAKKSDVLESIYKPKGEKAKKSSKLKVQVSKR